MAIYALEDRILFDAAGPGESDTTGDTTTDGDKTPVESEPIAEQQKETDKQNSSSEPDPASEPENTPQEGNRTPSSSDNSSGSDQAAQDSNNSSDNTTESNENSEQSSSDESTDQADEQDSAAETESSESDSSSDDEQLSGGDREEEERNEIAFVSGSLSDKEAIIETLEEEEIEVIVVQSTDSGLDLISETLEGREDIGAVHVFSHGGDGHFVLGSDVVDSASLEKNEELIQGWTSALSEDGDINLYGCKIAESDSGKAFVNRLAKLTQADVAASTDDTGSTETGGDWELEYGNGTVASRLDFSSTRTISLLADYKVDNPGDTDDGNYSAGNLTLREAIKLANANPGADVITFADTISTISLAGTELLITDSLTINGEGRIIIDGGYVTGNFGSGTRIFNINDSDDTTNLDITLNDLTLQKGNSDSSVEHTGGAIFSRENLTINNTTISGSTATIWNGGGIYAGWGTTTINNSTISGNTAWSGGGVYAGRGTTIINNSTISGNTAGLGGGLGAWNSTTTINNSTISGNTTWNRGGGVSASYGDTTINNSTISGNTARDRGGGVYTRYSTTSVNNSTISGNKATYDDGGGVFIRADSGTTTTISSTIVGNNSGGGNDDDIFKTGGTLNVDYSLIETNSGFTIDTGTGNIIDVDPLLDDLADNGGPTWTHALLAGSPALNNGFHAAPAGQFDQRGAGFNRDDGAGVDIGAYEDQNPVLSLEVDYLVDEFDTDYSTGDLSLREAIELAKSPYIADTINFASSLVSGSTINMTQYDATTAPWGGQFEIAHDLTINGDGRITIDGGYTGTAGTGSRIFNIDDTSAGGDDSVNQNVTLSGLTLQNGNAYYYYGGGGSGNGYFGGGAIYSRENLTITNSTITKNINSGFSFHYSLYGGGILIKNSNSVDVTISNSTISYNTSSSHGGGLYVQTPDGATTISDTDFVGNTLSGGAVGGGAHITNGSGTTTISNSTFDLNEAGSVGGLYIRSDLGTITISDTTISRNEANWNFGGGYVRSDHSGTITIDNSSVYRNRAGNNGGGLGIKILGSSAEATVSNITVTDNEAQTLDGGGVYIRQVDGKLTISNSTISDNSAGGDGGGLFLYSWRGSSTIDNSTISDNEAANGKGGGVYVRTHGDDVTTLLSSTVSDNIADGAGGGVFSRAYDTSSFSVAGSTLSANESKGSGGGISVNVNETATISITNSTISGNETTAAHGGGVGVTVNSSGATSSITNTTITNNTSKQHGGGIHSSVLADNGTSRISSTIIGANISIDETSEDLYDASSADPLRQISADHSLISTLNGHGVADSATSGDGLGNIVG